MINIDERQFIPLKNYISEYKELNSTGEFAPVAVGRYGIRTRESIYSKELAKDYSKNKLIFKDTLTVGMGSVQIDISILTDDVTYSVSPAYHTYRISGIDSDYLRYCLQCRNKDMFLRYVKRGSRQGKSIDLKRWLTYEIPVYSDVQQNEIVKNLKISEKIIEKRKLQLKYLEDLISGRFVEFFGDIILNDKEWHTDSWNRIVKIVNGRNQKHVESKTGNYLICGSGGAMGRATEYLVKENSVIVGRKGNINKPILMREKYWNVDTAFGIEPNESIVNVDYLYMFCMFFDFERLNKAVTIPSLTKADLLEIKMPIPPMALQEQFAAFVEQVDKSKLCGEMEVAA